MKIFVTHISALEFWFAYSQSRIPSCSRALPQPGQTPSKKELAAFDFERFGICNRPVHIATASAKERIQAHHVKTHLWTADKSDRPFVRVTDELYVASPETCFLQMAATSTVPQLVLLGLELCGTYRLDLGFESGFRGMPQLLRAQYLEQGIQNKSHERGVVRARTAARYIVDGSASPMESLLLALLCLPTSLGGYAIELPNLNYRVDSQKQPFGSTVGDYFFCDLFWPHAHLAIEYDSEKYHAELGREGHDSARRTALGLEDVDVVSVKWEQVHDVLKFDELAHLLAKKLGKPLRIRRKDFEKRRSMLRKELWPATFDW